MFKMKLEKACEHSSKAQFRYEYNIADLEKIVSWNKTLAFRKKKKLIPPFFTELCIFVGCTDMVRVIIAGV